MIVKDWSAGIHTRVDMSLIPTNKAIKYDNCDNESMSLKPIKAPKDLGIPVGRYYHYFTVEDKIVSSDIETFYAEYRDTLYSMSEDGAYKYTKGIKNTLGIEAPVETLDISSTNNSDLNDWVKLTLGISSIYDEVSEIMKEEIYSPKALVGTYVYVYTYYNSVDGTESVPSRLSNSLEVDANSIKVEGIKASSNSQVDTIRLYRLGGTLRQYSLVAELENIDQEFEDINTDWAVAGSHVLDSFHSYQPPKNGRNLALANSMLFCSVDDKLYYSGVADHNSWSRTDFIDFDDDITGIGSTQHGLLVFTKFTTYIVTGSSPTTFSKYLLSGEQGCINHRTIGFIDNTLIWVSTDGVCTSNGGKVDIISQDSLGKLSLNTVNAIVHDRMYLLSTEDNILVFDFRYSPCIRTIGQRGTLGLWNDTVYIENSGYLYELLGSDDNATMYFKSGILSIQSYSTYKTFKDIYIAYKGDIHIKVFIHTETSVKTILDTKLPEDRLQYNAKTKGEFSGYGISYIIYGTGSVYEIDFKGVTKNGD